jgi:flagellar basal body-associated protein FliL
MRKDRKLEKALKKIERGKMPKKRKKDAPFWLLNISLILGIISSLLAIFLLPLPFFNGHSLWEDLVVNNPKLIEITYLGDNLGQIAFQITNQYPYLVNDVKMVANLNCDKNNKTIALILNSNLKSIPSGSSDIFYIADKDLLSSINSTNGSDLEYQNLVRDYPVYWEALNKNIYVLQYTGKITKSPLNTSEITLYYEICNLTTFISYTYTSFGKTNKKEKLVQELTLATIDVNGGKSWKDGPFTVGEGGTGNFFTNICKKYCSECRKYVDEFEALRSGIKPGEIVESFPFMCKYWFCQQVKKEFPLDNISCLVHLMGVCTWHGVKGENLPICQDIEKKIASDCIYFENDSCHLYNGSIIQFD